MTAIDVSQSPPAPSPVTASHLRLLHTSDWHLGQMFYGHDRSVEHQCFLDWLLLALVEQQIDVLLIAGDIYDQAHPAASTQRQFYAFLVAARQRCPQLQIVIVAGNHDSPARLEAPGPLLDELGISLVGHYPAQQAEQLLLPLTDRQGQTVAWCLAVPYLRPSELPQRSSDSGDAYVSGIAGVYAELCGLALRQRAPGQALIAMGHLHLRGGSTSAESERHLVVGGVEAVDPGIFDPALAYVALGHLHLAQAFGDGHIRYCGSPLPLSFAEQNYPHQVLIVELGGAQLRAVTPLRVPRFVGLLKMPAQAAAADVVLQLLADLQLPATAAGLEPFVEVLVEVDQPEPGLAARIQAAVQGKALRFARLRTVVAAGNAAAGVEAPVEQLPDLSQLDPAQLLQIHYQRLYGQDLPSALAQAFAELQRELVL
jgi:exonuclease SbcD